MANAIPRNAPCPCGSGKKYKQCCIDKAGDPVRGKRRLLIPTLIAIASVAAGVYVMLEVGIGTGIAVAAGGFIAAGAWLALADPPPPSGGGNPAGLDFGRK